MPIAPRGHLLSCEYTTMKRYSFHLNACHKATLALLASVFCLPLSYGAQSTDELVEMALAKNPELRLYGPR